MAARSFLAWGVLLLELCSGCHAGGEPLDDFNGLLQVNLQMKRSLDPPLIYYRQSLSNFGDVQYVGNFSLGHQLLQGVLDTGSYEILAFSTQCFTCGMAAKYSHLHSSTYEAGRLMKTTSYGSGSAIAFDGTDVVSLGPFTVKEQPFWEAMSASMPVLYAATFQAIVGLGPPGEPQFEAAAMMEEAKSLMGNGGLPRGLRQQVREQMEVAELTMAKNDSLLLNLGVRYFSACLAWTSGAPGYIIWNDMPPQEQAVPFKQLHVIGQLRWSLRLSAAAFRGQEGTIGLGCTDGCEAVLDTGTSLIAVPTSVYDMALTQLKKLDANCLNIGQMPDLVITLDGHEYSLPPQSYVGVVQGGPPMGSDIWFPRRGSAGACELLLMDAGFMAGSLGPMWIIGMPFFRYYYTTFDLGAAPLDPTSRRIWTAAASGECHPAPEHVLVQKLNFAKMQTSWSINGSLLRDPRVHLEPTKTSVRK